MATPPRVTPPSPVAPKSNTPTPPVGVQVDFPTLQSHKPDTVEEDDSNDTLPDHVKEEIAAGRKSVETAKSKTQAEIDEGKRQHERHKKRLGRSNNTPPTEPTETMGPEDVHPRDVSKHDQRMSPEFLRGGKTPDNVIK